MSISASPEAASTVRARWAGDCKSITYPMLLGELPERHHHLIAGLEDERDRALVAVAQDLAAHHRLLRVVDRPFHAVVPGAVRAAVKASVGLDAVPDDPAAAVLAARREPVHRALEAVEDVALARGEHLERTVVVVAADFADGHGRAPGNAARRLEQ
jgi:hypothetical protein